MDNIVPQLDALNYLMPESPPPTPENWIYLESPPPTPENWNESDDIYRKCFKDNGNVGFMGVKHWNRTGSGKPESNKDIYGFVQFYLNNQLTIAHHLSNICNQKIYIYSETGFFDTLSVNQPINGIPCLTRESRRLIYTEVNKVNKVIKNSIDLNEPLIGVFKYYKDVFGVYVVGDTVSPENALSEEIDLLCRESMMPE